MYGIGYISRNLKDTLQVGNGLGKPTIKFEFEDNQALADFLTKTKGNVDYAETVDADTFSNPMTVNNRRQSRKAAQQKAITTTQTNYLPPSDGTPSLPPSPTSPKALPPYRNVFPARQKFDKVKAVYPDYIAFVKDGDYYITYDDDAKKIAPFLKTNLLKDKNGDAFVGFVDSALPINVAILNVEGLTCAVVDKNGNVEIMQPPATNEPPVVKFTPKKPKQKEPEKNTLVDRRSELERAHKQAQDIISNDKVETTYLAPDIPVKTLYLDDFLNGSDLIPYFKNKYGNDVLVGIVGESKENPTITFFFDDAVKVGKLIKQRVRGNNAYIVIKKNVLPAIRKIKDFYDVILFDYKVKGLGKPTIKLEFEDNGELMSLFDTDGISGLTVNDKPAAVFNCPESELDTQGYAPTYIRLADYSHLIDAADGAKTLKGYGFEKATLDELVNACQNYRQVERLAAHLKDDDEMQSAFNVWHWLHTNVRYNYDTPGEEEIRTPARVWADRESGVDCDCLAVFTACLLINMGYQPRFEIVAFNDSPTYSHIYVNLDGVAIDRVLPVFMARPQNITKTKIMEIPVYELSGIGRCNGLNGVFSSTLAKMQNGTATAEDINNYRKTQVLVTLKGIDEDAYKLAALLMPHIATIGDDGKYYFDNAKFAEIAQKADAGLTLLKQQGASKEVMQNWLSELVSDIDIAENVKANYNGDDTIVVIINPKGLPCRVAGNFTAADLQTLSPMAQTAMAQTSTPQSAAAESPIFATTPAPATPPDAESESSNTWLWIAGISAAIGIGAALASGSGNKKRR